MRERFGVFVVVGVAAWAELLRDRLDRGDIFEIVGVAADGEAAIDHLERLESPPDIVLLDVGARLALDTARTLRGRDPTVRLVAIGLDDNAAEVLSWAMVGAIGLVARNASLDELLGALTSVAQGEAPCSPRVTAALLRGVRNSSSSMLNEMLKERQAGRLTDRELEVARLVAHGFSNKEIAIHLQIEPGTVKSHVHSVIHKLGVSRRAQVAGKLSPDGLRPDWPESGCR